MGHKYLFLYFSLALVLLLMGGCSSDDDIVDPVITTPPPAMPFAASEAILMQNFRTAYEEMNSRNLAAMLHPDFVTFLQPGTQAIYPNIGPTIDRELEIRIANRMFAGEPVTDPDGQLVHGISAIRFDHFEQQGYWTQASAGDAIPEAWFAFFEVMILVDRPEFATTKTFGQIKFYVASRDSFHNGATRLYWEMIGQSDLTYSKSKVTEGVIWGTLKGLFR